MEGPVTPTPENPGHNTDSNAYQPNQNNENDDNNAPAGPPNAPPNQPPNQHPNQPPNQPAPQPSPNQPAPANSGWYSLACSKLATAFSTPASPSNNTSTNGQLEPFQA